MLSLLKYKEFGISLINKLRAPFSKNKTSIHDSHFVPPEDPLPKVPSFPLKLSDLDKVGQLLDTSNQTGGKDHPGFKDPVYKAARNRIAEVSFHYKMGTPIPKIDYSANEHGTWAYVYAILRPLQDQYMCRQFNENVKKLEKAGIYHPKIIPQLEDVNQFLIKETGFRLKPVSGILTQREFLNALALRVFCSTQYIRHHLTPEYTPEPDIIHELLGHAPMFADPEFAELSQYIGILSLGNSEENIIKLSTLYWYTVEFGVCKEGNDIKGYGAGVASSIGEIKNMGEKKAAFEPLDPFRKLITDYPIQTYQPVYYVAESFKDAGEILKRYGESLNKPFTATFEKKTSTIQTDRRVMFEEVNEKPIDF